MHIKWYIYHIPYIEYILNEPLMQRKISNMRPSFVVVVKVVVVCCLLFYVVLVIVVDAGNCWKQWRRKRLSWALFLSVKSSRKRLITRRRLLPG